MSKTTVTISASSDYNTAGKQWLRHITGRHPKFTFDGEFIGRRSGKRGDVSSATVDEPGLYQEHDVTRKGATDTFVIVWRDVDGVTLRRDVTDEEEAMSLARRLDGGEQIDWTALMVAAEIKHQERKLAVRADGDPEELVGPLEYTIGVGPTALAKGTKHPRRVVRAARQAEITRLRGEVPAERPLDLDGGPTAPTRTSLEAELAALDARRAEIVAALAAL